MAATGVLFLAACLASGQGAGVPAWDFEVLAPLHPNPQVRRAQFSELVTAIQADKGRLTLEGGPEQVLDDLEANWIPGSIPRGAEGNLHKAPYVRGVIFYDPSVRGSLKKTDHYQVEFRLFVSGKRDARSAVWRITRSYLSELGFVDGYGYDTADFAKLKGSLPGGKIHALVEEQARRRLVNAAADPVIKDPAPILSVHVLREGTTQVVPIPPPPTGEAARMPPDTRAALIGPGAAGKPEDPMGENEGAAKPAASGRYEVILHAVNDNNSPQSTFDLDWWGSLGDGAVLEARMGSLLSVRCSPTQALKIARHPDVAQVRLPRAGAIARRLGEPAGKPQAIPRGQSANSPLVVIHHDFQGWREALGKTLPPGTVMVDLTRERNPGLLSDPYPTSAGQTGPGTNLAVACTGKNGIAPVLVRIDPASPAMVRRLVSALAGERYPNELLLVRQGEAREEISRLTGQLTKAEEAREAAETNTEGDSADQLAVRKKTRETIEGINKRINALARLDQDIVFFQSDLVSLAKSGVVVSGVSWLEGHPQGGMAGVSRLIEEALQGRLVWIQIVPETRPQVWAGTLADRDGNGFAELRPGVPPHDAEFLPLTWKNPGGQPATGGKFRLTVQHHEAHHPELVRTRPDLYRTPVNRMRPVVVYQDLGARPGDPWEVIGQGDGWALKLQQDGAGATWEQQVDVLVGKPGKYAVRLEADPAKDVVPRELASIPASGRRHAADVRMLLSPVEGAGWPEWVQASAWLPERPAWVATPGLAGGCLTVGPASGTTTLELAPGMRCKPEIGIGGLIPNRVETERMHKLAGETALEALGSWVRGLGIEQTRARFQRVAPSPDY